MLPVGCSFAAGTPLIRIVHANFVEADTHDWFRVSEVYKVDEEWLVPEFFALAHQYNILYRGTDLAQT